MIVLDCNAALAIAKNTDTGQAMQMLMMNDERITAPQLFFSEMAHALEKHVRGGHETVEGAISTGKNAIKLVDDFVPADDYWAEALTESARLGHSAYDLFYFLLARRTGSTLFTLDKKLQNLCLDNGVECIAIMKG